MARVIYSGSEHISRYAHGVFASGVDIGELN